MPTMQMIYYFRSLFYKHDRTRGDRPTTTSAPRPTQAPTSEATSTNRTAFALCLIFGAFGFHRFYLRRYATGVLYALTFGIVGLGVVADLVLILCKRLPQRPRHTPSEVAA